MKRALKLLLFLILVTIVSYTCIERLVAGDEGYLLLSSKLLNNGLLPYRDFFFPQTPFLTIFFSTIFLIFGTSFVVARMTQVVVFLLLVTVFIKLLLKKLERKISVILAVAIVLVSELTFPWYSTIQAYAICALGSMILVFLNQHSQKSHRNILYPLCSGLLISGLASFRLYMLALGVVPFLYSYKRSYNQVLFFICGVLLGLIPLLSIALYTGFDNFYINNFYYHILRSSLSFSDGLEQKFHVLGSLLGLHESRKFHGFLVPFLFWTAIISWTIRGFNRNLRFYDFIGITLIVISFIPTPCYFQYFSIPAPFVILSSIKLADFTGIKTVKLNIYYGMIIVACCLSIPSIYAYLESGKGVIGIKADTDTKFKKVYYLDKIGVAFNQQFEEKISHESRILTEWPGNILTANILPVGGTENNFGYSMAKALKQKGKSNKVLDKLKVITKKDSYNLIKSKQVEWLLFRDRYIEHKPRLGNLINTSNKTTSYKKVLTINGVSVYKLTR